MSFPNNINLPTQQDQIFKDECMYSYDTPNCKDGLYTCMKRFISFGNRRVLEYSNASGNTVFLLSKKTSVKKAKCENPSKISKMAIGVEGGFSGDSDNVTVEQEFKVVILPEFKVLQIDDCPEIIRSVAKAIIKSISAMDEIECNDKAIWDGGNLINSRFASDLKQLPVTRPLASSGWKCDECEKMDNLWLNLTDGSILCGRKFFDGTGGNNHALEHYSKVKYPLAVKLGTITSKGADVYSYGEDDMVIDPFLVKHLKHFGINAGDMEKTEKTMNELEIHANEKYGEWNLMQETGDLKPALGACFTGMHNLGNSCYMNSLMQVLFSIPDFIDEYYDKYEKIVKDNSFQGGLHNFKLQMSKLSYGLLSGDYSLPENKEDDQGNTLLVHNGIKPKVFKNMIGKGHSEFSGKGQQDVQEFLLHVIDKIKKNSHNGVDVTECMKFQIEEKLRCKDSNKVRMTTRDEYMLSLSVNLEKCTNMEAHLLRKKELEDKKNEGTYTGDLPSIPMQLSQKDLFSTFAEREVIQDVYSYEIRGQTTAFKTVRMKTFPDFLFLHIKKFTFDAKWQPLKLDLAIDVADEIDLSSLQANGLEGDEVMLDEREEENNRQYDQGILDHLLGMGFSENGIKRSMRAKMQDKTPPNVQICLEWIMQHMDDPDFNSPILPKSAPPAVCSENVDMICAMGFTKQQSTFALQQTQNIVDRAIEWIFSHSEEIYAMTSSNKPNEPKYRDGSAKYRLTAFICHMGKNTGCGHYVAHIRRDNSSTNQNPGWFIYNDDKVAHSEKPPKQLAYMYLYKRI